MFRINLKFFTRVFLKDKFFSSLNIFGLALGIAVSILLMLILQNDLNYDKYHEKHKRIYRLGGHLQATGIEYRGARSARELAPILKEELPEVENFVRAEAWDRAMVKTNPREGEPKGFHEDHIVRADSTFFDVFSYEFITGNPKKCLVNLNTVVLTESVANKYFGSDDPIGKSLIIYDEAYEVTAVIEDVPENTHLKFDLLLSRPSEREWVIQNGAVTSEAFWNPDIYTYLLLEENYDAEKFQSKFDPIYVKHFKPFGDKVGGKYTPILESLASIHFHSKLVGDEPQGNLAYVYAFTGIGIFIVLLACINYMNLSTAKAVNRAAEIAMKKTMGSGRTSLVISFLSESIFLAVISMALALVFVSLILEVTSFNELIDKNLHFNIRENPMLLPGSLGISLTLGILSGLYPAFYLTSLPTLKALKGAFKNRESSHTMRKVLTTLQFAISIFVITCTIFMKDQINFVRNKELGFDKDNVLILPILDTLVEKQVNGIKSELVKNPRITGVTTAYNVPGFNTGGQTVMWAETDDGMKQQAFNVMFVGDDYIKTMNMEFLAGKDFPAGRSFDLDGTFIANEAAVKLLGWDKDLGDGADDAIGKKVKWFHAEKDGQVIGVVKDFNFSSLHNAIEPLLMIKAPTDGGFLHLKVSGNNLPETLAQVESQWAKFDPNHPFEFFFLDQKFNEQYQDDETQYKLLSALSYVCIFISLLGLLGLSAFSANQRTKEIGIRKIHGATVPQIIYMLFREVMYLVIIAAVLIVPIALAVINQWLSNFAYQGGLRYETFILIGALALTITFLTVAFHSLKTAYTNPAVALKCE